MNSFESDFYISMLPDNGSSARRRNYNDHLHGEIIPSDFFRMLQNPPCKLYLHVDDLLSPSKKTSTSSSFKKSNKIKMPRNQNPFILYRKNEAARRKIFGIKNNSSIKMISKEISEMWHNESPKIKTFFQILATEGDRRHRLKFPEYKYTPVRKNKIDSKKCLRIKLHDTVPEKKSEKKESVSDNNNNNRESGQESKKMEMDKLDNVQENDNASLLFADLPQSNDVSFYEHNVHFFDPAFFLFDQQQYDPILFSQPIEVLSQQPQQPQFHFSTVNTVNENINFMNNQYGYDYPQFNYFPYYGYYV